MRQFTAGMWVFGQIIDRYATDGYGPPVATLDLIAEAATSGIVGLDLNYPFPEPDLDGKSVAAAMAEHQLASVCITPAIYTRRFARGAFTNPDPSVRRAAIDLAHEAVALAKELGAPYVKFWPGQDGYDYPFQCDYATYTRLATEGIASVARNFPDIEFGIEYKLKEPRNHLFWSGAPRTLLAIEQMGLDNVGIVIDFGHSLFAKENPAEMLHLVHGAGRLIDIELCDNYREWDDDLLPGALHLPETLEFLAAVASIGWDRPLKLDLFPYREDAAGAVREAIATLRALDERCERLDLDRLQRAQQDQDPLRTQAELRRVLLG